ncbi:helix-turn-helix domain-containing protein [Zestomonas thermotolerans]|uniref:helix-turn-helix domain-containing protein n=1 Tax=Zestomonas thermotolerans TaxID=157784 RepID=UPI0003732C71|nr:AraC family transcriptional regulator [Pseudomonas thermotolerans]MBO2508988.1 AraC family transcriptional regulator [Gammaproteobacteria bacterium]
MPQLLQHQVFQSLASSPHARLERCAELNDGLALAIWRNHHDSREYHSPGHHTLTCYLDGGTGTFRRERPAEKGAPDKLCVLPAGHESAWVINGDIRLVHLYVSDERFALDALRLFDREPREMQLREHTFLDDPVQALRFRRLIALPWEEPGERLLVSSLSHELLDHLLRTQAAPRQNPLLRGGLAPQQRRLLQDYIAQHLDEPLELDDLASLVALSPYHFARMFRISFGVPPHRYLLARRLERACRLLRDSLLPLGEIALACGFASASHFSNRFRAALGGTPGQYRAAFA